MTKSLQILFIFILLGSNLNLSAEEPFHMKMVSPGSKQVYLIGGPKNYEGLRLYQFSRDFKEWETIFESVGELPRGPLGWGSFYQGGEAGFWRIVLAGDPAPDDIQGFVLEGEFQNRGTILFDFSDPESVHIKGSGFEWTVNYLAGKISPSEIEVVFSNRTKDFPWEKIKFRWGKSKSGGGRTSPRFLFGQVERFEFGVKKPVN